MTCEFYMVDTETARKSAKDPVAVAVVDGSGSDFEELDEADLNASITGTDPNSVRIEEEWLKTLKALNKINKEKNHLLRRQSKRRKKNASN